MLFPRDQPKTPKRILEAWRSIRHSEPKSGELALRLKYRLDPADPERMTVHCGEVELTDYLGAWDQLPPLQPLAGAMVAGEPPHA